MKNVKVKNSVRPLGLRYIAEFCNQNIKPKNEKCKSEK